MRARGKYVDDKADDDKNVIKSKFQLSLDNPTMMEIYPYGGVLAFLNYHFLDGVTKQNLMLYDKTRYIYGDKKAIPKSTTRTSSEDAKKKAARFGIGTESDMDKVRNEIGD